ncbi:MAG TPA: YetF domain-containing protein [Gemmatimonadaceae bacterium]|nr:YetF domain-containing protein [Gemmatimonadaceae bacterium]
MHGVWLDLFAPGVPLAEKALRTVAVYAFLLLGLRLAGKRELSQLNQFDLVVLLLLSNTVQNAIIGNDNSLLGGIFGAAVLLLVNGVLVRVLYHYGQLEKIEGKPDVLVKNGRIQHHHLERELITLAELQAAARRQGIESLAHVKDCRLETGGALTFVAKQPTDEERRHKDVLLRLERVEIAQNKLLEQLEAVVLKMERVGKTS